MVRARVHGILGVSTLVEWIQPTGEQTFDDWLLHAERYEVPVDFEQWFLEAPKAPMLNIPRYEVING